MTPNWIEKLADWGWEAFTTVFIGAFGWVWHMERRFSSFRLHVSENYVKKTDIILLKEDIAADFKDVKASQAQILDLLLQRKIGTTARRR
jgi:hypothetical protein